MTASGAATDFDRATAPRRAADGAIVADLDPRYAAPTGPNGGYLAALVARAIGLEADPDGERRLRSLTCHYLRPPRAGEVGIDVEVLRSGRRLTSVRATLHQEGRPAVVALAALAVPGLPAAGEWDAMSAGLPPVAGPPPSPGAPVVPASDWGRDTDGWLGVPHRDGDLPGLLDVVPIAPRSGAVPFSGRPVPADRPAEASGWIGLPEPRRVDAAFVAQAADAWWPPAFGALLAPAIAPTVDLTVHVRADLGPDGLDPQPLFGRFRSALALGGFVEEDATLQLADGTLVAHSRQLSLLVEAA